MKSFDQQFADSIRAIMTEGDTMYHERTDTEIKAIPGMHFECYPQHGFPVLTLRKIPIRIFVAEIVWYIMGSQRPAEFISEFTKIWDDFTHEDGTVPAAYGYRWRHHFGRDQLDSLIKHLEEERTSRQGVVVTWDPGDDSLGSPNKKLNVPCPYTFTVNIIEDKLNLHCTARSTDMMLGLPHDVAGHALLQRVFAQRLKAKVGKLSFTTSHAHVYGNHFDQALEVMERQANHAPVEFELPPNTYERAANGDRELVKEIVSLIKNQYEPQAPLGKMRIAIGKAN